MLRSLATAWPSRAGARARHHRDIFVVFGLVVVTFLTGCGAQRVSLAQGYRSYDAGDYSEVLKRWTRKTQALSLQQTDDLLTVQATYQSWDFRWAYAARYAEDNQLGSAEAAAYRDTTLRDGLAAHEFYVTLYGSAVRWTELDKPTSAWIVRLVDDQGAVTSPSDIARVRRPGAQERNYFPYTTPWRNVYRIRFPKIANDGQRESISPRAQWMALRFSGPQGRAQLTWQLQPMENTQDSAAQAR